MSLSGYNEPERSAEIGICEIFGRDVREQEATVGMGVHPFGDPRIVDEFPAVRVPVDAREFHDCAAEWTPEQVVFFVDGRPSRASASRRHIRCSSCSASTSFPPTPTSRPVRRRTRSSSPSTTCAGIGDGLEPHRSHDWCR
jgi:hypothetical protein